MTYLGGLTSARTSLFELVGHRPPGAWCGVADPHTPSCSTFLSAPCAVQESGLPELEAGVVEYLASRRAVLRQMAVLDDCERLVAQVGATGVRLRWGQHPAQPPILETTFCFVSVPIIPLNMCPPSWCATELPPCVFNSGKDCLTWHPSQEALPQVDQGMLSSKPHSWAVRLKKRCANLAVSVAMLWNDPQAPPAVPCKCVMHSAAECRSATWPRPRRARSALTWPPCMHRSQRCR